MRNPYSRTLPHGIPALTGFAMEDKERLNRWTTMLANGVSVNANAAQTLARAVQSACP